MAWNITLGARKKILLNIEKLRKRSERLRELIQVVIFDYVTSPKTELY